MGSVRLPPNPITAERKTQQNALNPIRRSATIFAATEVVKSELGNNDFGVVGGDSSVSGAGSSGS